MLDVPTQGGSAGLAPASLLDLAESRQEPEWLRALRRQAFETYQALPLAEYPTGNWRHADLSGLSLANLALPPAKRSVAAPDASPDAGHAGLLTLLDGSATRSWLEPDLQARGVRLTSLESALDDERLANRVRPLLEAGAGQATEKLAALNAALFQAAAVVYVPRGVVVQKPLTLCYTYEQSGSVALPLTLLILEEGAEAAVLEMHQCADPAADIPVASAVAEMRLGPNASLHYARVQRWPATTWAFWTQRCELQADARARLLDVPLAGGRSRETIRVLLDGAGSQADVLGVVAGQGREHVDFQTLQEHRGSATRSDLVIHNALAGRSSANFTGLIRIEPDARHTESSQEQKNILLSPRAQANSDPRLEILNNDVVRCTHGAAVGPVDPELIFYLQTRGLDHQTAEALIVDGFFQSVLTRLQHADLQQEVWNALLAKRQSLAR